MYKALGNKKLLTFSIFFGHHVYIKCEFGKIKCIEYLKKKLFAIEWGQKF